MRRVVSGMLGVVLIWSVLGLTMSCSMGTFLNDPSSSFTSQGQNRIKSGSVSKAQFMNELVYFDFESDKISLIAKEILRRKVSWLKDNPREVIIVEGHCDEKGTKAYNLALGERRADAVKRFLINQGISGARLYSISYGSNRPVDSAKTEAAFSRNRRVALVIQ